MERNNEIDDVFDEAQLISDMDTQPHPDSFVDGDDDILQSTSEDDTETEEDQGTETEEDDPDVDVEDENDDTTTKDKLLKKAKDNWFYLLAGGLGLFVFYNIFSAYNAANAPVNQMNSTEPNNVLPQQATPPQDNQSGFDFSPNGNIKTTNGNGKTIKVVPQNNETATQEFVDSTDRFSGVKVGLSESEVRTLIAEELKAFFRNQDFVPKQEFQAMKTQIAEVTGAINQRLKTVEDSQSNFVPIGVFNVMNEKVQTIKGNVEDVIKNTNKGIKLLDARLLKIESMPIVSTRNKSTQSNITPHKTNYIRYKLVSAMKDKAWIKSSGGDLVMLDVGDSLKGYGEIIKITPSGNIETVSGRVLLKD